VSDPMLLAPGIRRNEPTFTALALQNGFHRYRRSTVALPIDYRDSTNGEAPRHAPDRTSRQRLAREWRAITESQQWIDGAMPPVGIWKEAAVAADSDPRENPKDDPRQENDWGSAKQTDKPWKGNPEKDQLAPNRRKPDLEQWQESNTH